MPRALSTCSLHANWAAEVSDEEVEAAAVQEATFPSVRQQNCRSLVQSAWRSFTARRRAGKYPFLATRSDVGARRLQDRSQPHAPLLQHLRSLLGRSEDTTPRNRKSLTLRNNKPRSNRRRSLSDHESSDNKTNGERHSEEYGIGDAKSAVNALYRSPRKPPVAKSAAYVNTARWTNTLWIYKQLDPSDVGYVDILDAAARLRPLISKANDDFLVHLERLVAILQDLRAYVSSRGVVEQTVAIAAIRRAIDTASPSCRVYGILRVASKSLDRRARDALAAQTGISSAARFIRGRYVPSGLLSPKASVGRGKSYRKARSFEDASLLEHVRRTCLNRERTASRLRAELQEQTNASCSFQPDLAASTQSFRRLKKYRRPLIPRKRISKSVCPVFPDAIDVRPPGCPCDLCAECRCHGGTAAALRCQQYARRHGSATSNKRGISTEGTSVPQEKDDAALGIQYVVVVPVTPEPTVTWEASLRRSDGRCTTSTTSEIPLPESHRSGIAPEKVTPSQHPSFSSHRVPRPSKPATVPRTRKQPPLNTAEEKLSAQQKDLLLLDDFLASK